MIAVNVAVALAQDCAGRVALMEGCASLGDAALLLNAHPPHVLVDLVTDPSRLDADLVRGALLEHASGIDVLFAAKKMEDGARMTQDLLAAALRHLKRISRYVVVDTAPEVNDVLVEVLAAADVVMLVTTPELTSLRRASAFLEEARGEDFPVGKLRLVLNREGIAGGFSSADISQRLGLPVAACLPDDPALVAYSINRGMPLMMSHPKSLLARRLQELSVHLAETTHGRAGEGAPEVAQKGSRIRLPGGLRLKGAWG